ncbi:MAG: beta-ketoacyl-ACP synthase II [Alphaproteobacteria bacterium]
MELRNVVVTGCGIVSPLGVGADYVWKRLVEGHSGINQIHGFEIDDLPAKIAGQIPLGDTALGKFNVDDWVDKKEQRKMEPFIQYAMAAADMAIADSGYEALSDEQKERTGVLIGSGIGGLDGITQGGYTIAEKGVKRLSPFFIPSNLINLASGFVSIKHGYQGPNHAVVTACATGTHAIGDAARLIALGDADAMIAGGAEAAVCRIGMAGFCAARALSTGYNDDPEAGSRPWDKGRDGFVMGEGAGIVMLEEEQAAIKRGARIYARVSGYGMSGDAYHLTAPAEDGNGGYRAMKAALRNAQMNADHIDYINAHGTSTPLGDEIEAGAIRRLLGDHATKIAISSTKSSIGHLLGAAGAVEAIFSVMAIKHQTAPPTLNLNDVASSCADLNLVPLTAQQRGIKTVLSNSFGFGGTNACLVFTQHSA